MVELEKKIPEGQNHHPSEKTLTNHFVVEKGLWHRLYSRVREYISCFISDTRHLAGNIGMPF